MPNDQDLGANLRLLHSLRGSPSYKSIARALEGSLGAYAPSDQTISNWHKGLPSPHTADLVIGAALAHYYGVKLSDLHPVLGERGRTVSDLLRDASGWTDDRCDRTRELVAA